MISLYARESQQAGDEDILLIDRIPMRASTTDSIQRVSALHAFSNSWDFSAPMGNPASFRPSFRKRWTRRLKTQPGFKQVYDFLYRRQQRKEIEVWVGRLQEKVLALAGTYDSVEIISQPMIRLLPSLRGLFPQAQVRFFEHGLGDYIDITDKLKPGDQFQALFGETFQRFRKEQGEDAGPIVPLKLDFGACLVDFQRVFPEVAPALAALPRELPWVLVATQPLEEFQVPNRYWDRFLGLMLADLPAQESFLFLIKPHPRQAMDICQYMVDFLTRQGHQALIWEQPETRFLSLEILFAWLGEHCRGVYSPFSCRLSML